MIQRSESIEDRLKRLTAETGGVVAREDFAARVMDHVERCQPAEASQADWSLQVMRWSKLGMAMATVAAAACIAIAWHVTNSAEQEEAMAYGVLEAFE
jgi:hypothetical protein